MKTMIIAGGTGFLGNLLVDYFQKKVDTIYILSRTQKANFGNIQHLVWDGKNLDHWQEKFNGADVVINLTGKSVDCRYTPENKELILSSRIDSTKVIGQAIQNCSHPPKVWLNSSTATIYRHSLEKEMDEYNGEIGEGFSVNVATAWEQSFFEFSGEKTRQVALRTSIVFGRNGGAFPPIKRLAQLGFGGKQGNGNQKVSWIHEHDFVQALEFIIQDPEIGGVINIVSPTPTTNSFLMKSLRKKIGIPFGLPLSKSLLEIGAKLINTEVELLLKSRNVIPQKLLDKGFKFTYPSLSQTIDHLMK